MKGVLTFLKNIKAVGQRKKKYLFIKPLMYLGQPNTNLPYISQTQVMINLMKEQVKRQEAVDDFLILQLLLMKLMSYALRILKSYGEILAAI